MMVVTYTGLSFVTSPQTICPWSQEDLSSWMVGADYLYTSPMALTC